MDADGIVVELLLMDALPVARIACPSSVIPGPGQYILAHADASSAPLAAPLFGAQHVSDGFVTAPPYPSDWRPGHLLHLRGPLGHGFALPRTARRVALIAWDGEPRRLLSLAEPAFAQGASITLVCGTPPRDLPLQLEVQPMGALGDVLRWSDYSAYDVARESLRALQTHLAQLGIPEFGGADQALIRTPMPCGGLAECGVCAVRGNDGPKLVCVDGPVVDLWSIGTER